MHSAGRVARVALLAAGLAVAAVVAEFGLHRSATQPVALQAVGAVGPGSLLTLQTAAGPMQLTVDSQMNQGKGGRPELTFPRVS
jgi:hypothetical protein